MIESRIPLGAIAHARSGDKGNHANIAVLAYTQAGFGWLQKHLTPEVVQRYFASLNPSRVIRYEAANVLGLNFVLYDVLAGGASRSLRIDTQGKTLALALLHMEIKPDLRRRDAMWRPRPKGKAKRFKEVIQDMMNMLGAPPNQKRKKKT
jgi:hypothetical protein